MELQRREWKARIPQVPFFTEKIWFYDQDEKFHVFNMVAHRRAGKSEGFAMSIARRADIFLREKEVYRVRGDVDSKNPVMIYVAPTKNQARQIIWDYLLTYLRPFTNRHVNNSTLTITIPRPALEDKITVYLMSSKNHDRIRGLKVRDLYGDEMQDAPANAMETSMKPALQDTRGRLYTSATSKGQDHHYEFLKRYHGLGATFLKFPITKTAIFTEDEVAEIRSSTPPDQFEREYMCSYVAPVSGSFYAEKLNKYKQTPWFYTARNIPSRVNIMGLDIGIGKGMVAWTLQVDYTQNTLDIIDYYEDYNLLGDLKRDVLDDKFYPDYIVAPHDTAKRIFASYVQKTNYDVVKEVFPEPAIIQNKPSPNKMSDITTVGQNLHILRFPDPTDINVKTDAHRGLRHLVEFARLVDPKTGYFKDDFDKSRGNDHAADALRGIYMALRIREGRIRRVLDRKLGTVHQLHQIGNMPNYGLLSSHGSLWNHGHQQEIEPCQNTTVPPMGMFGHRRGR